MCGASVPVFGGVALDLCGLDGIVDVDTHSLVADIRAGTFGPDVESALRTGSGVTLGHWPQSMDLSTVGGWLACRGAGQYSNRYGKIEDMVIGLEVVLADGRVMRTGGHGPRSATGPDLTQLFVGSEGTLGVITEGALPGPPGARGPRGVGPSASPPSPTASTPAGSSCAGAPRPPCSASTTGPSRDGRSTCPTPTSSSCWTRATRPWSRPPWPSSTPECREADALDVDLVERWLGHRNDVSALAPLWRAGVVVDTVEISARWRALPGLYDSVLTAMGGVEGTLVASSHQSHAYTDGACLYFTFAGRPPDEPRGRRPPVVGEPVLPPGLGRGHGGHHGRRRCHQPPPRHRHQPGPLPARRPGGGFEVLASVKYALDPHGILNPGKLGPARPLRRRSAWP